MKTTQHIGNRVFNRPFTLGGGGGAFVPPYHMVGTSAGEPIINGGTHEGGHRPYEGT